MAETKMFRFSKFSLFKKNLTPKNTKNAKKLHFVEFAYFRVRHNF